jgi:cell division inhibitor SepF
VKARVSSSTVRTVPSAQQTKPSTVRPRRFEQAQEVADRFKEGQPVIVNLQDIERDLSRRLIDFCSGLCYGLGGRMERVASGVYLLTPTSADVSDEDRQAISEHGFGV